VLAIQRFSNFIQESKLIPTGGTYIDGKTRNIRVPSEPGEPSTILFMVLKKIYDSGYEGMRYTDILRFIIEEIKGETYHHSTHRGHYATNLIGDKSPSFQWSGRAYKNGILRDFCTKKQDGKYVLTDEKLIEYFNSVSGEEFMDPTTVKTFMDIINYM